jgi:hypothetical protein
MGRSMKRTAKSTGGKTPLMMARTGLDVSTLTQNNQKDSRWESTDPGKERSCLTKSVDVGYETHKGNGDSPNDDQSNSQGPRDDGLDLSLVRVHLHVGPFDILGYDFDARLDET